ncbi:MAG: TatD family deoxyribonuclease [Desulfobacterium sp.]|nr:TatD family deoxyribonuclease [Desulfobacterium sp.]MBU3950232.1 TatD family hydrolase [Pseudomonadota bacterium]MBU4009223.1 TatD family hydrolase [Pseudomonadota bacterium]MBU4036617.1 TatD family hydrolase [Pseudomonadota bacterium]
MRFFDSHCHLDDRAYDKDLALVVNRAKKAGVVKIMIVGIDMKSSFKAVKIAETYPGFYASVGVHPHDSKECSDNTINHLKDLSENIKVKAWGEIGLDYNRMFSPIEEQEKWFIRQLEAADELGLPIIFHERGSNGRFFDILKDHKKEEINGVIHCFSGNREELEKCLDLGLHIGITGILTIANRGEELRNMISIIPNDRILIETDAPYLTPAPEKNQTRRNEPAFVKSVFLKLAEIKKEDPEVLSQKIFENTCRLFNINPV